MQDIHTCYKKMQKAMFVTFCMFLGGGTVMVEISIIAHNVYFWTFGIVLAMTSGIFITMGLVAKQKLKAMSK